MCVHQYFYCFFRPTPQNEFEESDLEGLNLDRCTREEHEVFFAMWDALEAGRTTVLEDMMSKANQMSTSLFLLNVVNDNKDMKYAKMAIRYSADVNSFSSFYIAGRPLKRAIENGDFPFAKYLMQAGCTFDSRGEDASRNLMYLSSLRYLREQQSRFRQDPASRQFVTDEFAPFATFLHDIGLAPFDADFYIKYTASHVPDNAFALNEEKKRVRNFFNLPVYSYTPSLQNVVLKTGTSGSSLLNRRQQIDLAKKYFEKGASLTSRDSQGSCPLIRLSELGAADLVQQGFTKLLQPIRSNDMGSKFEVRGSVRLLVRATFRVEEFHTLAKFSASSRYARAATAGTICGQRFHSIGSIGNLDFIGNDNICDIAVRLVDQSVAMRASILQNLLRNMMDADSHVDALSWVAEFADCTLLEFMFKLQRFFKNGTYRD